MTNITNLDDFLNKREIRDGLFDIYEKVCRKQCIPRRVDDKPLILCRP